MQSPPPDHVSLCARPALLGDADRRRHDAGTRAALLTLILGRQSVSPKRLLPPGPTLEEIHTLVEAALTAPDHGGLRPSRFILISNSARQPLADAFVAAKRRRDPCAAPELLEREREKALRAPALLAVVVRLTHDRPDVPDSEQLISVGAAVQNVLLAAAALDYGAIILSGEKVRDTHIRTALGLDAAELLVGFISIGTTVADGPRKVRRKATEHMSIWTGPAETAGR